MIDGLWSEKIKDDMTLVIEDPNTNLYSVFTTTEAALIWKKEESTIRKAISNCKFQK